MLELTFLGSANAFTPGGRYWSSFLVNGRYLVEAPPTLLPHLKRLGIPLADIHAVFISHFHGDHFLGLPFLFLEYLYLTPRREDLHIVGPPGVREVMEGLAEMAFPNLSRADAGYQRRYLEAEPGQEQGFDDVRFQAITMSHASEKLTSLGYRLHIGERVVAFSGDSELCEQVFALGKDADVLVLDCSYSEGTGAEHMSLADALEVRKRLPPSTTIVLTHLEAEPDVSGLDGVLVAQDFATFRFP
ncbi:MAG: MBL fold metallo-hydrolase [Chloroflexota bacterium]|nr:MBL fold metallo-hydrolase [Chloroflexota bacterium]